MDYRLVNFNRNGRVGVLEYFVGVIELLACVGLGLGVLMLVWAL